MNQKREAELLRRIEDLERKVRELEARHPVVYHNHYHYQQPHYVSVPYPSYPVYSPHWIATSGGIGGGSVASGSGTTVLSQ